MKRLLERLSNARGVSGREREVREILTDEIASSCDRLSTDALGTLYATCDGDGPRICLLAHMDEVGMMITHVDKDGYASFSSVGGIRPGLFPGARVLVGDDAVPGVIGHQPVHLQGTDQRERPVDADALRIDVGDAADAIGIGDVATFDTTFFEQGGTFFGKAFDDRIGCACLASLLAQGTDAALTCVFTVQEEVGLRGASVAHAHVDAAYAIACEGTFALDMPGMKDHERMPLMGKGPAITLADRTLIADQGVLAAIVSSAKDAGIPYQYKRPFLGGTDAGAFHTGGAGTPSAVIAVPCRYIHSPCALAHPGDVSAMAALVARTVERLAGVRA